MLNTSKYKFTIGAALSLMLAVVGFGQSPKQDGARELLPNQTIHREMIGAEKHRYQFNLKRDEFFQVRVEQQGVDVALKLTDVSGAALAAMDSPNGKEGVETFSFAADAAGSFVLEVAGFDAQTAKGNYTLTRFAGQTATAQNRRRVAVEKLFAEGMAARDTAGQIEPAIGKLEAALAGWRELNDEYLIELTSQIINQLKAAVKSPQANAVFNEASALFNQGTAESYRVALEKFGEASRLYEAANDTSENAGLSLLASGLISDYLGEKTTALGFCERALKFFRAHDYKSYEATTLTGIGKIYTELGENKKAIEVNSQSLMLSRQIGDKSGAALTLNNIGEIYSILGENKKALEFYNQSLLLTKQIGDKSGEARTLSNIGVIYLTLGVKQKALEFFNQSLPLLQLTGDKRGEAVARNNIGGVYSDLGEKQKALEFYSQSLLLRRQIGDKSGEAVTLNNLGMINLTLGEKQKSLDYFNQSLSVCRQVGNKSSEATALSNIGLVYSALDEKQKALEFYSQSLPLRRQVGDKHGEAVSLNNIMVSWNSLKNVRLAIFYGKQSVNKYQELRQAIETLDKETQKSFLGTVEGTYRYLADILVAEGRLLEAQQVLAMLKENEYLGYVRRDADEIKKLIARADLHPDERAALLKYETLAGKVTEYGTRFAKLEELKQKQGAGFAQATEYADLKTKLDAANAAFRIFLDKELVAELGKPVKKEIELDRALQAKLQQWGNGTVALYTVAGDDRYRVILTTPRTQTDGKTEIKISDLNRKIFLFRAALQNPAVDPRPLGKELYDILIKPIEKDLEQANAKTLVWSLDGTLRYIPFAALSPDGVHYLAEKYQNVVVTSTTRQSLVAETDANWRLLGAGVTKESKLIEPNGTQEISFSALPSVEKELLQIIGSEDAQTGETKLTAGRKLIDDKFNLAAFEDGMSQRVGGKPKYNVIHLATHFNLGGDTAKSFLLMGNNQALTLDMVSDDTALDFGAVELVTLSACNTGFGTAMENKIASREQENNLLAKNNGAEVDSLATFIELRGAKSVLASLWAVADESTALLMSEFYRLRKTNPAMTKAEAMQAAQISMISGKLSAKTAEIIPRSKLGGVTDGEGKAFPFNAEKPFAHPYFWSPFVLIGNWR